MNSSFFLDNFGFFFAKRSNKANLLFGCDKENYGLNRAVRLLIELFVETVIRVDAIW